jgi:hypothetical protein
MSFNFTRRHLDLVHGGYTNLVDGRDIIIIKCWILSTEARKYLLNMWSFVPVFFSELKEYVSSDESTAFC